PHGVTEAGHGAAQVSEPVAEVAADGQDRGGGAHLERRRVTATSANSWAIGAPGLCTVTSTVDTRGSTRQASASRDASVSMRFTGSPPTIAASRSANSP